MKYKALFEAIIRNNKTFESLLLPQSKEDIEAISTLIIHPDTEIRRLFPLGIELHY